MIMKKRILIFGAGVIGSTYGGLLAKSGHSVTFYARNKRLIELREKGLLLQRNNQSVPESIAVETISKINEEPYDYVIVALRKEQVNEALQELTGINSQNFVFMVNNPLGYADWIKVLGNDRVIPAFPGSVGKIENGVVCYEIVSRIVQPTTIGELSGKITARIQELRRILSKAGFPVSISCNMDAWQKTHIAMVAPMADVIYYDGGNNYTVAKNRAAIKQMNLSLRENFVFLHRSGIGVEPFKLNFFRLSPLWLLNFLMKYLFNTKWAETVICNHALNARQEMKVVSNEFLEIAKSKGFKLKEFEKLVESI